MRRRTDRPELSGSALASHLGCRHLTQLDLAVTGGTPTPPAWRDPILAVLQERGGSSREPVSRTYGHEVVRYRGLSRVGSSEAATGGAEDMTEERTRCANGLGSYSSCWRAGTAAAGQPGAASRHGDLHLPDG
jgi:hypothetical protein